jgi:multiple sugar transport system ATP-binding protein
MEELTKVYPNGQKALDALDVNVADGEFLVMVGPSGCGKTTALRMVAGLEEVTSGVVRIGERIVNDVAPKDRDVAMVFQNYALYPHMSVAENIGFPLKLRHVPKAEISAKVNEVAKLLGLDQVLNRKPGQLSGGQRQRVAMGRAIVREPTVFLMDEPLSNLDAKLRVQMRSEVMRIQRRLGTATLYVTHDQVEAMTMGDRVAVLSGGVLQQCDTPQTLYDRPCNLFVAAFIGSPSMNLFYAGLADDGRSVKLGSQTIPLPDALQARRPGLISYRGRSVIVGIRPEHLSLAQEESPAVLAGEVTLVEALGSEQLVHFRIDAAQHRVEGAHDDSDEDELPMFEGDSGASGTARIDPKGQVRVHETVRFGLDPMELHLFDPSTGRAIWE